jgi:Stage II sporulation protein E (SpoIIE)
VNIEKGHIRTRGWYIKIILFAFIGLTGTGTYFFLVQQAPPVKLLNPNRDITKAEIIEKAESFFKQFPTREMKGIKPFTQIVTTRIDESLFRYAQYHKEQSGKFPDLPVGSWRVTWLIKSVGSDSNYKKFRVFDIFLDFNGDLLGFEANRSYIDFRDQKELKVDDAPMEARYFLETLGIETKSLVLTNKDISETPEKATIYKFTLKNKITIYPHLTETYRFEIVAGRVIGYWKESSLDRDQLGWNRKNREGMADFLAKAITWMAVCLILIIMFIRKLRRDELEFKHALRLGIFTALLVAVSLAASSGGNFLEMIIIAGLSGVGVIICLLMVYPTAEAVARDVWPEKVEVMDLLFQGRFSVWETGAGILRAYFITGITLFVISILILVSSTIHLGHLSFSSNLLNVFQDLKGASFVIFKNISLSILMGSLFFFFWPAFLKGKLSKHPRLLIFLLAVTFDLAALHGLFFRPQYLYIILVFPIALFWAYAVYRWGFFTILLAFAWTKFLLDLVLILKMPHAVYSFQGMIALIFPILFMGLGIYLVFRPGSVKDYEAYIPEYITRIAEKERFLKELEIARGVQMRFLPQKVPQSPNLEIVSLCQPAMEVGGDYFDFIRRDDRYMTILIGDVSGKGVSAAFYMTMVKGIIKTLSKKTLEPATLLAEANDIFYENAPRDVFITIIYGVFDLQEKTLTVASAGHNPLIVWRQKDSVMEMINPRGLALGLAHGEQYQSKIDQKCIPISEKDVFVFYTDGVTEAMNTQDEVYGEERLKGVIKKFAHLSPQQLQERIVESVAYFSGKAPQHDDFTMVVVKVRTS